MRVTSARQRVAFARRSLPDVEEVRPGIFAVPQVMPELRLPYSLSYLVVRGSAVHVIDTGMPGEENWSRLTAALATVGHGIGSVASVTLTHLHRDHAGQAERLRESSGAVVRMHEDDARAVKSRAPRIGPEEFEASLERWAVPEPARRALRDEVLRASRPEELITVDETLHDGDLLDLDGCRVRVLHTPGHTAGHVCLVLEEEGLVFTGDHVLPAMSSGIGLGGAADGFDPLSDYLRSVRRIQMLGDLEVCPGHGYRFVGVAERCGEILDHHERRRGAVAETLRRDPELTTWQLATLLWQERGWDEMDSGTRFSALGQAEMHARALTPE